jgi:hypothetical protein
MDYTVGCDAEGRLVAVRARIVGDNGAYGSVGMKVLERAAAHACGPYRVPNIDVEARAVYTNNPPSGAMRGFGVNQTAFAIEDMVDRLAELVGIDGWEMRWRNALREGDRFASGQVLGPGVGLEKTLLAVRDAYRSAPLAGIACGVKNTGIGNGMTEYGRAILRPEADGTITLYHSWTEMGQGCHTSSPAGRLDGPRSADPGRGHGARLDTGRPPRGRRARRPGGHGRRRRVRGFRRAARGARRPRFRARSSGLTTPLGTSRAGHPFRLRLRPIVIPTMTAGSRGSSPPTTSAR